MHHTQAELLRSLDPSDPGTVQALIDFHRLTFGGWKMEGEGDQPGQGESNGGDPKPGEGEQQGGESGDKPLGPNGEKALAAEREARKALEAQLAEFKTIKAGLAALAGVDQKDAKSSTEDVLASVQQQLASMQRDNLVLSVANTHKITDEDDLGLLRDFNGDEESLRKLAARLKPSDDPKGEQPKKRTPSPDPSQGRGKGEAVPGDAGRAEAARRFKKTPVQQ